MPLSSDPAKRAKSIANLRRAPSDDPAVRERQLQNLRPAPPAPKDNQRHLVHGGRSELLLRDVEAEVAELAAALGDAAPVNDPADVIAFEAAARALKRYRSLAAWLDAHGRITEKTGQVKPAADLELEAERQLWKALDRLGLNPLARSRLKLNVVRAHRTLEDEVQSGREAWERHGVIDGTAHDGGLDGAGADVEVDG